MKYKIPVPEDYPEVEGYEFKLSRAYSKLYCDFLSVLTVIDIVMETENKDDPIVREVSDQMLNKIIKKYKVK